MPLLVKARSFLRNLIFARRVDADLDQEVRSHLELLIEEKIRAGMSPTEAQRAARIELGGIAQVQEQVRDERLGNWLHSAWSDCRYGLRHLRKNPGTTAVMVFTLALGIGASTAIFSVVYGVLLRPLPYADSRRIMAVFEVTSHGQPSRLADPNFDDFRDQNRSFNQEGIFHLLHFLVDDDGTGVDRFYLGQGEIDFEQFRPYIGDKAVFLIGPFL